MIILFIIIANLCIISDNKKKTHNEKIIESIFPTILIVIPPHSLDVHFVEKDSLLAKLSQFILFNTSTQPWITSHIGVGLSGLVI